MKKSVQNRLAKDAKRLLAKRKPSIIAVTGSVGKSSTKQAIWAVLKDRFAARVSPTDHMIANSSGRPTKTMIRNPMTLRNELMAPSSIFSVQITIWTGIHPSELKYAFDGK